MTVIATIEARMASSRLPGKVMLPLAGEPMLAQLVKRVRAAKTVDKVIILSSVQPENRIIQYMADRIGVEFFAGSENDVLDRVLRGTAQDNPDIIVQLTGDNPALAPQLIDDLVTFMKQEGCDYASNYLTQEVILGQNVRCFTRDALVQADGLCQDAKMRSHGGYYIQTRPDLFKLAECPVRPDIIRDDIRLTVDEPEDFEVLSRLFETFDGHVFNLDEMLAFFAQNPDVCLFNQQVVQKTPGDG